jgi:hypothetical protein
MSVTSQPATRASNSILLGQAGRVWSRSLACALLLLLSSSATFAQWVTQTISLNSGWNAVFLEVQPGPSDCETLFASLPVESVWGWNRRFSSVQFIQDANQLVPGQPDWLTYFPADHPAHATRTLFTLQAGHTYLVKLKAGSGPVFWNIVGHPVTRQIDWLPNSLNLVGFPLASAGAPTFSSFFAGSSAHTGQPIYRLNTSGQWQLTPSSTAMRAGEAFWINCLGASTFSGPIQLTLEQRDGLLFAKVSTEQTVRIKNSGTAPTSFTAQKTFSQFPPDNTFPMMAGAVPLSYYRVDATNRQFGWIGLTGQLSRVNVQPGEEWVLRFQVNRTQMANYVPPATHNGVLYQSVLQISNSAGARFLLSVSAEGLKSYPPTSVAPSPLGPSPKHFDAALTAAAAPDPRAGLWVGNAVIDRVSQPANISAPDSPTPVASPLNFRLLIHVDNDGHVRLLQKVLQMFKTGTYKPDPNDPDKNVVDQPGRYVLLTDDSLIPNFSGAALRDGQPVPRRISSAAFGFSQPILLSGSTSFGAGTFACQVNLDYDHPSNPFKHTFHPDHDNLDARFQNKLPEGVESFSILRQITLEFTAQDPDNLTVPGWGDNQIGGIYREIISGLHNRAINVSGTFRLTRASTVGVLNDGLQ